MTVFTATPGLDDTHWTQRTSSTAVPVPARRAWHRLIRCLLVLLWCAALAHAQEPSDPDAVLAQAREAVQRIERQLQDNRLGTEALPNTRRELQELGERAAAVAASQAPLLASSQARLEELGKTATEAEAADVTEQRRLLQKTVSQIDARIKLARLLVLTSEQLAETAGIRARERFAAELFEPTDSLLSRRFRDGLLKNLPSDSDRASRMGRHLDGWLKSRSAGQWMFAATFLVVAAGLWPWSRRAAHRAIATRVPSGRLRRSLGTLASVLLALVMPLAATLAVLVLVEQPGSRSALERLFIGVAGMVSFCILVAALGRALLAPTRPSWRLPPIPDGVAAGMKNTPNWLALTLLFGWSLRQTAELAQLSLQSVVAVEAAVTLALAVVLARCLGRHERLWRSAAQRHTRPWWLAVLSAAIGVLLLLAVLALLAGYVALAGVIVGQVVWVLVLSGAAYLLDAVIVDLSGAWVGTQGAVAAHGTDAVARRRRAQFAVLAAGALRVILVVLLLTLLFAPFGEEPTRLLGRAARLGEGITIGDLQIRPAAVARAILVVVLASAAVRVLQRWAAERLLPTTSLDAGMQSSLATLLGFVGGVIAVALGLSAMGLALNQVAWVASALTVGLGFGMQAVVSNFVSGLILLAERPVKVGDWVAIGPLEGDIRRINVRATEIQMPDRSTLIVPNSEFITKVVRNVTQSSQAQGLVQVKLPMPLSVEPESVRQILLATFKAHREILGEPAPAVLLDGIEADKLVFSATGFVASPRRSAAVRSELLFGVLRELHGRGLLGSPAPLPVT
jgi:potassium efflux system protein